MHACARMQLSGGSDVDVPDSTPSHQNRGLLASKSKLTALFGSQSLNCDFFSLINECILHKQAVPVLIKKAAAVSQVLQSW